MNKAPYDLRDYALGELDSAQRSELERWLETRPEERGELDRLLATCRTLRSAPTEEPPRRIAFVSDKVFEPSRWRRIWSWFEQEGPRLGFSLAAVLAVLFAGLWATEPTVRRTPDGLELAFGGTPKTAVSTPAAETMTAEQVRALIGEALAERPALDRAVALELVESRVAATEQRLSDEIEAVRTGAEEGYFRLASDLEVIQNGMASFDIASAQ